MQFFEVKIKWYCGDPDEDFIEGDFCQGCGEEFETIEGKQEWNQGSAYAECPKCGVSLDASQGVLVEQGKIKGLKKKRRSLLK